MSADPGINIGAFVLITVVVLGILGLYCYYLSDLRNLLKEIDPRNRKIAPNNVFLMLIPLVNWAYGFIMYPNIAKSVEAEYEDRQFEPIGENFKNLSMAMPILVVSNVALRQINEKLGTLVTFAWLVVWIIYWVKTSEIKRRLKETSTAERIKDNDLLD